jgi:lipopolysaccharide transport system ATP-binding protein
VDQRAQFINSSNLRNDIRVFEFDLEAPSFGKGAARIASVKLLDTRDRPLSWIVGGEDVVLQVEALVHQFLDSPIIGFYVKDKLGQYLFGDNTWLSYMDAPVSCDAGQTIVARFEFNMPRLCSGDYSITVAIANGDQDEHVQHHWVHDALLFRSESTSVSGGLIGIPMNAIELRVAETK